MPVAQRPTARKMTSMQFVVLTAEFAHETNTFSRIQTGYDKFLARSFCLQGDAAIAARGNANTELAGFLDAARQHDWDVIHVISASANPGGLVTRDAFERLAGPSSRPRSKTGVASTALRWDYTAPW